MQENCVERRKHYESPTLARLTGEQSRSHMLNHARELLELLFPGRVRQVEEMSHESRGYEAPRVTKLTPEQAKLKLLGHFGFGDPGARDLLELVFPETNAPMSDVPANSAARFSQLTSQDVPRQGHSAARPA